MTIRQAKPTETKNGAEDKKDGTEPKKKRLRLSAAPSSDTDMKDDEVEKRMQDELSMLYAHASETVQMRGYTRGAEVPILEEDGRDDAYLIIKCTPATKNLVMSLGAIISQTGGYWSGGLWEIV